MSQELIYTSAPKGLKLGSRGFCTVASTTGMAKSLADRLEALSGYRHVYVPPDPRTHLNPVNFSYLKITVGGELYFVLSRIADAGLDYTQRTNKIAHHVAILAQERVAAGPAWVASQPQFFETAWTSEPRLLTTGRPIPDGRVTSGICTAWKEATGDAGWAGVLAQTILDRSDGEAYIIYRPGMDVLPLLAEAQSLLPPQMRWDATFSTYFSGVPAGADCRWRCILADSPEAAVARRSRSAVEIINLCSPLEKAQENPLAAAARAGALSQAIALNAEDALYTSSKIGSRDGNANIGVGKDSNFFKPRVSDTHSSAFDAPRERVIPPPRTGHPIVFRSGRRRKWLIAASMFLFLATLSITLLYGYNELPNHLHRLSLKLAGLDPRSDRIPKKRPSQQPDNSNSSNPKKDTPATPKDKPKERQVPEPQKNGFPIIGNGPKEPVKPSEKDDREGDQDPPASKSSKSLDKLPQNHNSQENRDSPANPEEIPRANDPTGAPTDTCCADFANIPTCQPVALSGASEAKNSTDEGRLFKIHSKDCQAASAFSIDLYSLVEKPTLSLHKGTSDSYTVCERNNVHHEVAYFGSMRAEDGVYLTFRWNRIAVGKISLTGELSQSVLAVYPQTPGPGRRHADRRMVVWLKKVDLQGKPLTFDKMDHVEREVHILPNFEDIHLRDVVLYCHPKDFGEIQPKECQVRENQSGRFSFGPRGSFRCEIKLVIPSAGQQNKRRIIPTFSAPDLKGESALVALNDKWLRILDAQLKNNSSEKTVLSEIHSVIESDRAKYPGDYHKQIVDGNWEQLETMMEDKAFEKLRPLIRKLADARHLEELVSCCKQLTEEAKIDLCVTTKVRSLSDDKSNYNIDLDVYIAGNPPTP